MPHLAITCSLHTPGDVRIYSRLTCGFAARGWQVSLIAPEYPPIPRMPAGAEYYPIGIVKGYAKRLFSAKRVLPILQRIKPDAALFPDPDLMPTMLKFGRRNGTVVAFDRHEPHDVLSAIHVRDALSWFLAWGYTRVERILTPQLDGVVIVQEDMKAALPDSVNTCLAHNFPTRAVLDELAKPPAPGTPSYTCVQVGTHEYSRGSLQMLDIVHELVIKRGRKDFSVLFAGGYDVGLAEDMESYIELHQLTDNVTLKPHRISHEDAVNLTRAAKIGFSPFVNNVRCRTGLLHNKLPEFMGAGLPVIFSPAMLSGKIVKESGCGVNLWIEETEKISDQIEAWMDNPEEAQRIGEKGRKYVNEHLVWENELDRLEGWLKGLIVARGKGRSVVSSPTQV